MCTGAELALLSTAATVGKTGLDFVNNRSAAKREDRAASDAIRRQSGFNKQATDAINATLPALQPEQRGQAIQDETDQIVNKGVQDITAQDAITGGLPQNINQGRVSEDFLVSRANEAKRTTKRGAELARLIGRVRAPETTAQNESFDRAKLATDLGQIQSFGAGQAGVDQIKIQNAGQLNPLLSLASGVAGGVSAGANAKAIAEARLPGTPASLSKAGAPPPGVRTYPLPNAKPVQLRKLT